MLRDLRVTSFVRATMLIALALTSYPSVGAQSTVPAVHTVDDPEFGTILVDASGAVLYVLDQEQSEQGACSSDCVASLRPAVAGPESDFQLAAANADATVSDEQVRLGVRTGDDGSQQLVYDGRPLFREGEGGALATMSAAASPAAGAWVPANALPLVRVVQHPVLGSILVGPNGRTLYTYDNDAAGDPYTCDEGCSENFPPLIVAARSALGSATARRALAIIARRADSHRGARLQVAYGGRPLYYFSRDVAPGDVTGDGVAGFWHVARP